MMQQEKKIISIAFHYREILKALGEDVHSVHLIQTPIRAAKSILYLTSGNQEQPGNSVHI